MKKLRSHPTKTLESLDRDGWTVILRLTFAVGRYQWVPTYMGANGRLYNAIGAGMARSDKVIAIFATYDGAKAAIRATMRASRAEAKKRGRMLSDMPDHWKNEAAWTIAPVKFAEVAW